MELGGWGIGDGGGWGGKMKGGGGGREVGRGGRIRGWRDGVNSWERAAS